MGSTRNCLSSPALEEDSSEKIVTYLFTNSRDPFDSTFLLTASVKVGRLLDGASVCWSVNRHVEAIDRFHFGGWDSYQNLNCKMEAEAEAVEAA